MTSYFFSEMPYAAVLHASYLRVHCSNCFARMESMQSCSNDCKEVVYCSESCVKIDRPFHTSECLAYRNGQLRPQSEYNDLQVRLLGRILTRRKVDKGVAMLSDDFPRHLAKDRCLNNLMSHERKFKRKPSYPQTLDGITKDFARFFSQTSLADVKDKKLAHFFNVVKINGFSITCILSADPRTMVDLGEGVCLNASRFNHSCIPTLLFSFAGSQLVAKRIEDEQPENEDVASRSDGERKAERKPLTKKELKGLTFSYGFGTSWNNGTGMSLASQRLRSLRERYFFRCRCPLCRDKRKSLLQVDAASVECSRCDQPYVWKRKEGKAKVSLKKLCKCRVDDESAKWKMIRDPEVQREIKWLNEDFDAAVASDPSSLIADFEWVVSLAEKYWHPTYNLRFGQLNEKVLLVWHSEVRKLRAAKQPFDEELESALKAGERMLASYLRYAMPWDLTMAILLDRLSALYLQKKHDEAKWQRASELCTMAARVWNRNGEESCQKFLIDLAQSMAEKIPTAKNGKSQTVPAENE